MILRLGNAVCWLYAILLLHAAPASAQTTPPTAPLVDGTNISSTAFPSVARISLGGNLCTGTLLAPRFILTAAHCFFDSENNRVVGDAGAFSLIGGQSRQSIAVHIHPTYVSRSEACVDNEFDSALIELAEDVTGVTPVEMIRSAVPVGSELTLVGFGLQGSGDNGTNGTVPASGTVNFGTTFADEVRNTYIFWTFRRTRGGSNTAGGDSGGPAFFASQGSTVLAGITCGGTGDSEFGTESVDTRVDRIAAWVDSIAGTESAPHAPQFLGPFVTGATVGVPFSFTVHATGTAPISLQADGLPAGLSFNGTSITGVPAENGIFDVALTASNSLGADQGSLRIVVVGYSPDLDVARITLRFDLNADEEDFLHIRGRITVGPRFQPRGKRVKVQIGQFVRSFRLDQFGTGGRSRDQFQLIGQMRSGRFVRARLGFRIKLEDLELFDELATLGFPATVDAEPEEQVPLPVSLTIRGIVSSDTETLSFDSSTQRWHN